jgi:excisionase family DNA binding protein
MAHHINSSSLLTMREVAQLLKVPRSWIYDRTRRNAIPVQRVGKYLRFDQQEIRAWARANCPRGEAPRRRE